MAVNAVKIYRSTDTGAPVLSGSAGALEAVIKACLIDGYNSKTITITRSGSTATATCTAHGFTSDAFQALRISGADQTEYNINTPIFNVTANTFDFTVTGTPATPATGTITAKVMPNDIWARTYSGTNKAVYRTGDTSGGSRFYHRFEDSTTTYASHAVYESMTDVDTGIDATTTNYWHKSSTADATARPWILFTDDRVILFFAAFHASNANNYAYYVAGDVTSEVTGDLYGAMSIAHNSTATPASPGVCFSICAINLPTYISNTTTDFSISGRLSRDGSGVTKNAGVYQWDPYSLKGASTSVKTIVGSYYTTASYVMSTPNNANGGYYATRIGVLQVTGGAAPLSVGIRGWVPGVYVPLQYRSIPHTNTYVSTSPLTTGRRFYSINIGSATVTAELTGSVHVDMTGPWR